MNGRLIQQLATELMDIRSLINSAENGGNPYDFITARLAVNEAEITLDKIKQEVGKDVVRVGEK